MTAQVRSARSEEARSVAPGMRRRLIAIGAAWLVPGLGHVVLGNFRRGIVFAVLILGSFGLGLAHEGRLALHDDNQPILSTLQVIANVGIGPADLIARITVYGEPAYAMPKDSGYPAAEEREHIFRERTRSHNSNYGTAYLWTAGLMNLLLLFDVWDIGRRRKS